jgi:uncharacterized protein YbbK (DUF523 family)
LGENKGRRASLKWGNNLSLHFATMKWRRQFTAAFSANADQTLKFRRAIMSPRRSKSCGKNFILAGSQESLDC